MRSVLKPKRRTIGASTKLRPEMTPRAAAAAVPEVNPPLTVFADAACRVQNERKDHLETTIRLHFCILIKRR